MQLKHTFILIAMWLLCHMPAAAQILLPDNPSTPPVSQPKVHLLPPIKLVSVPMETKSTSNAYENFADGVIETAMTLLGSRYSSGAMGPRYFDCSGFTSYVYKKNNVTLNRTSRSQYTQGISVSRSELQKGDLVFFGGSRSRNSIGHVGIVTHKDSVGNGFSFVHACRRGVIISRSDERYYSVRYIGARRININ